MDACERVGGRDRGVWKDVRNERDRAATAATRTATGISYAIARLQQRVFAGVTERVTPYGLTTLQFTTLSVLSRHGRRSRRRNSRVGRS